MLPAGDITQFVTLSVLIHDAQNKNRKLAWYYSLGLCTLKGGFDAKPVEIVLGTQQVSVCVCVFAWCEKKR